MQIQDRFESGALPMGVATSPMKVVSWLGAVVRKNFLTLKKTFLLA
jgi:hypothetical protein